MRSGSITTTGGRCGNSGCHCRKEGDPGHSPFHRLTRKVRGKTVTETFAIPVALRKAQPVAAATTFPLRTSAICLPPVAGVGEVELPRPWYLFPQCHNGQFSADTELDLDKTDLSPGVRRILALVGAEAIGGDIVSGQQRELQRAMQLDLPVVVCQPIPFLYQQMGEDECPGAVDLESRRPAFSGRQHLWDVALKLYPNDDVNQKAWMKIHRRNCSTKAKPKSWKQHLFVGSGVIEAGCKTVIGSRLKQSGMFWTVQGANAIIALRRTHSSRFSNGCSGGHFGCVPLK